MSNYSNNIKLLTPKLDVVFKQLFGEVGSEKITSGFLEAILNEKINSINLSHNPILNREHLDDKLGVLDIVVEFNNNEYCDIEMQCISKPDIKERLVWYGDKLYTKQIKKGDHYDNLHRSIAILIADFNLDGLEHLPYFTSWKIIEEKYRKTILTESYQICIIELPKINNFKSNNDKLLDWLFFLDNPKSDRVVKKMEKNDALKQAHKKLEEMSQDEHMQKIAEWREKAIWEERSVKEDAYRRGHEAGVTQRNNSTVKKNGIKERYSTAVNKNGIKERYSTTVNKNGIKERNYSTTKRNCYKNAI